MCAGVPLRSWEHELTLHLKPGSTQLAHAELMPAEIDITDIDAAAEGGAQGLSFVVREVHARLASQLRRRALIEGKHSQLSSPAVRPWCPDISLGTQPLFSSQ
jgi:hypothetical protein